MRIAFLGLENSFDFNNIGGVDSIVRRLALSLVEMGDEVGLLSYGCAHGEKQRMDNNIEIEKHKSLAEAVSTIENNYDHVVSIYLKPRDRLTYARFRHASGRTIRFHHLYTSWHESRLKRELLFAEARLFPFNGCLFFVSQRIHRYVSRWATRAALFLPPVPENFFCRPEEKSNGEKLCLTYAGRVDPGKGTDRAVEVFERLGARDDIEACLCGFAWSHRPETIALHERLLVNSNIRYEPAEYKGWSPDVDENLCRLLRETDILLLPYEKLSSTVDTPLLFLEGMANLCAVITPPLGDLHDTYGQSVFNLRGAWSTEAVLELIERARPRLATERERLASRNADLGFDAQQTTENFRRHLVD